MSKAETERDPFRLPAEPRTGRELVWWTLFELPRLGRWSRALSRKRTAILYLSAVPWILLLFASLNFLALTTVATLDLPVRFPAQFQESVVTVFSANPDFPASLAALFAVSVARLALGAGLVLVGSLTENLARGLVTGLVFGLVYGLAFGLVADGAAGLIAGLTFGMVISSVLGAVPGMAMGLVFGLAFGLALSLAAGVGIFIGWMVGFLRLPFYVPQNLLAVVRLDLYHNPYLWDAGIRLPIWRARRKLADQSFADPVTGGAFASFLLEYRPFQHGLAAAVLHAAHAGRWRLRPLDPEVLSGPAVPEGVPAYVPSPAWLDELSGLRQDLAALRTQTQISLKRAAFAHFAERLDAFRERTLLESPRWNRWYLDALDTWLTEAGKELARLDDQAAMLEPIAANLYRTGTPLRPESDKAIFFGRDDLRQALAQEILTAAEMPLLLILGQRRVGKTSLLNFLPELLGSGFVVVAQDLMDDRIDGIPAWLADLRRRVAERLGRKDGGWQAPANWLAAWRGLREWLEGLGLDGRRKLILALDEYEQLHDRYLSKDSEQGDRLLAAMRSFSQHQNRVVLLFVGATPLSELCDPDWSRYFVHSQSFRVDYLARSDARRLITEPTPLRYPDAVVERLLDLTQGHPDLLQRLCQRLVSIANREGRHRMTAADLDEAVAAILVRDTAPMERFWNEACRDVACRACVEQVLAGEAPSDAVILLRLEEGGYLVCDDGRWRLRVPLFEDWLRKYRAAFPLPASAPPDGSS